MIKTILTFTALLLVLSACTVKKPHLKEYTLRTTASFHPSNLESNHCEKKTLKVLQTSSENKLYSSSMGYAIGTYHIDTFTESKWSKPPNKAIEDALLQELQKHKIFKKVIASNSRAKSELYLESNIYEFIQHFSEDTKKSNSILEIRLTLVNTKTKEILAAQTFKKNIPVTTMNAEGGVIALSKALTLFLEEQSQWLQKSCI